MTALGSLHLSDDLAAGSQIVPSGTITMFAGDTAPSGWLICDGKAYDGTNPTYQSLWTIIGVKYGGTGQAAFRVPDLRGRVPVGLSFKRADEAAATPRSEVDALGDSDGLGFQNRTVTHKHTISAQNTGGMSANSTHDHGALTGSGGNHTHTTTGTDGQHAHSGTVDPGGSSSHYHTGTTDWMNQNAAHSHGVNGQGSGTYYTGSSNAVDASPESGHSTIGPFARGFLGTDATDTNHRHTFSTSTVDIGTHQHTWSVTNQGVHAHTLSTHTGHQHSIPSADLSHTHVFSGTAGDNALSTSENPAYLVVNFIVKL